MKPRYQAPRGTRDILPDEIGRWQLLETAAREIFERYGYREIRTPILEVTELFARSVGLTSDIVRKEMYTLSAGGESVTLRPENTASVVRAFVEHSLHRGVAAGYPERYYYIGPMFRYERPQKGRQRQFHQIGAEVLGALEPLADAELLEMLWRFLDTLGIGDRELVIGTVGDAACRPAYRDRLKEWARPRLKDLCGDCRRRYDENPLRMLDCKLESDRKVLIQAPTLLDHLCAGCTGHFAEVRRLLDEFGIPHRVDPRVVRGLDYYQRTVFEVVASSLGAQNAILGGGRYDGLVEELGGPAMPGIGFAIGMERLLQLLPEEAGRKPVADVLVVALGGTGWRAAVSLTQRLRAAGVRALLPLQERPMSAQMRRVERSGARWAVFVGEGELERARYGLKDLITGEQHEVAEAELVAALRGDGHGE
jgi:histidyl-tRNA synthetase